VAQRILIVDDDPMVLMYSRAILERNGFNVVTAEEGETAVRMAIECAPDLVLLDLVMPGPDGLSICKRLKAHYETANIPVIILSQEEHPDEMVAAFDAGADDYVTKGSGALLLVARVRANLRRTTRELAANPLTRIPGITFLELEAERRLKAGSDFALAVCDIDNFKPFNDHYGLERGDHVILALGQILRKALLEISPSRDTCLSHVGGDDFVFLAPIPEIPLICNAIIKEFDSQVPNYYNDQDRAAGFIETLNRRGFLERYPLMTISMGIATTLSDNARRFAHLMEIANEIKGFLKRATISNYMMDRRRESSWGM